MGLQLRVSATVGGVSQTPLAVLEGLAVLVTVVWVTVAVMVRVTLERHVSGEDA